MLPMPEGNQRPLGAEVGPWCSRDLLMAGGLKRSKWHQNVYKAEIIVFYNYLDKGEKIINYGHI